MNRALFILDEDEANDDFIREAGELVSGVDAELIILTLLTDEELEADLETLEAIAEIEQTGYDETTVLKSAIASTEDLIDQTFGDRDVQCKAIAMTYDEGEKAEAIIDAADQYNCDHVFISGRKRSPTGKLVFGDTTQTVLLNFEGRVTVELS